MNDIFLLNLIISGRYDRDRLARHNSLIRLLNSLSRSGFTKLELTSFAHILVSASNEWILRLYQRFIRILPAANDRDYRESIKKVLEFVDNSDNKDKTDCLKELYNIISGQDSFELIPVFDGEKFTSLKILRDENSILISADFSAVGHVDILFKKQDEITDVIFYLDNDSIAAYFSEMADPLKKIMSDSGMICSFRFFSRGSVASALNAIINAGTTGGMFSTRR